jgi:beta-lactam-binding protein with PASTA domain
MLRNAGFDVTGSTIRAANARAGEVLSQRPPAGETWPLGTIVELVVAE